MAQCYKCGSDVDETDRFCMECGALNPAHPPLAEASGQPGNHPAIRPTPPTWLPTDGVPAITPMSTPASAPRSMFSPADTISCPRCGARLPKDAQFCGDCGERIGVPPAGMPTPVYQQPSAGMPPAPISLALPVPIAPPALPAADRSAVDLARPVLPPFRGSSWAAQPTPEIELPDHTWTPLTNAQQPGTPGQMFWVQSSPRPSGPAEVISGNAPGHPQGFAGVSFPQVMAPKRNKYPRSQVIIMIVAAIVTVVSATAGVIVQFFVK